MPQPTAANTNTIRQYNLRQMQGINRQITDTLKKPGLLGAYWTKLAADGPALAKEITNRLYIENAANRQMFCDARHWVNQNVADFGEAGFYMDPNRIRIQIRDDDWYSLYVEYNGTQSRSVKAIIPSIAENDQHFFNLMLKVAVPNSRKRDGYDYFKAKVAHFTIFTTVDAVDGRKPDRYTPLGFMHVKDDMALGRSHGTRFGQSYRRFFIQQKYIAPVPEVPARPAVPATETTSEIPAVPAVPAIPARTEYNIGMQNQIGNVSTMAIQFSRVVVGVLQQYFDAGFRVARPGTPAPANFYESANTMCMDTGGDIGGLNDVNDIDIDTIYKTEYGVQLIAATPKRGFKNARARESAEYFANGKAQEALRAARLPRVLPYDVIGGKRKTRRSNKKKRTTRRR